MTEPVVKHYRDASAGTLTPAEVLEYARALRLSAEALAAETDVPEALRRANEATSLLAALDEIARGREGTLRLGRVYRTRAKIQARLGRQDEALADAEAALAAVEPLARKEPEDAGIAHGLAGARADLVTFLWGAGRHQRAEAETPAAIAAVDRAVALAPGELAPARQRAAFTCESSLRAVADGQTEQAVRLAARATTLAEELARSFPASTAPLSLLSCAHGSAVMAFAATRPAEGVERARAGVDAARRALALDPSSRNARVDVAFALARSGYALLKAGRAAEAGDPLDEASRTLDELLAEDSRRLPRFLAKGMVLRLQALAAWHAGDRESALGRAAEARRLLGEAATLSPDSLEAAVRLANAALDEAAMLSASGREAEVAALLEKAEVRLAAFFADRNPGNAARLSRARLLAALGREAEAAPGPVLKPDLSLDSLRMAF